MPIQNPILIHSNTWRNGTTSLLAFFHFSNDLCLGILPALLPFIRNALDLDYLQAGGLLASLIITTGFAQFLGGWLGDRFPHRLLIAIGVGGVGICTLIAGLLGNYYSLIVIFVFMGLFAGLYHPSGIAMLSGRTEAQQRGRAIATHSVGGTVGFFIAPILGGVIATVMGWQTTFMLLCVPALLSIPLAIIYLPRGDSRIMKKSITNTISRAGVSWRPVITMAIMAITMEIVTGSAVAFYALFLVDIQGFTLGAAMMWIGLLRGGGIVGGLLGGYFADRWGRRQSVVTAFFASGPVLLSMLYLTGGPFLAMMFLFGLFNMMREVAVQVYLMDETPPHLRARLIGVYFGFGQGGSSLILPLVGHAMDNFGIMGVYVWIGATSTVISIFTLLLFSVGFRHTRRNQSLTE